MLKIEIFTFNPFQENTYLLINEQNQSIVVDPGCSNSAEQNELLNFVSSNNLTVIDHWLTHAHIDHVMGCKFIFDTFGHAPKLHADDLFLYNNAKQVANMYGLPYVQGPEPIIAFKEGDSIQFGDEVFKIVHLPGHAPGHVGFYNQANNVIFAGDVLFKQSIGRTDLPGGDFNTLAKSIKEKLYTLPKETTVYPGHGPETTIGYEMQFNGFVKA